MNKIPTKCLEIKNSRGQFYSSVHHFIQRKGYQLFYFFHTEFMHMKLLFCSRFIFSNEISKISEKKSMAENEC